MLIEALVADARAGAVAVLRRHGHAGEAQALTRSTLDPTDNFACLFRTLLVVEPSVRIAGPGASVTALAALRFCAARAAEQLAAGETTPDKIAMMLKEKLRGEA